MNGKQLLTSVLCCGAFFAAHAASGAGWTLTKDSLLLTDGSTYRYTVDTAEGKGLVSTTPTVGTLVGALGSSARIVAPDGTVRPADAVPAKGDRVQLLAANGKVTKSYPVGLRKEALAPTLTLSRNQVTAGVTTDLTLNFHAGQRTPRGTVNILFPKGMDVTLDNVTVNVIGRGDVVARNLDKQSIGRTGTNYSYSKVGDAAMTVRPDGSRLLTLSGLDLRPDNGIDVQLSVKGVRFDRKGAYPVKAFYTVAEPEKLVSPEAVATITAGSTVSDFTREPMRRGAYSGNADFSWTAFSWTPVEDAKSVKLMASTDNGKTWREIQAAIEPDLGRLTVSRLEPNKLYKFKLAVSGGSQAGSSNVASFYSGSFDAKANGLKGDGKTDDTDALNALIARIAALGGGMVEFGPGEYPVRTVHLASNVWLNVTKDAVIKGLPGGDAPEVTWFSDRAYRAGLSPTDPKPYRDPENYLTKQDVGHTFFRNTMFFGERIENVKIIGNGRITGGGALVTTDKVMNNAPDRRADKMFTFKLCKDIEIGGIDTPRDMWYDEERDEPYYIEGDAKKFDDPAMLHIDQGGHFVLLATGTDGIYVHDTYFGKYNTSNVRDIYDFMQCNDVKVKNIYSKVSSDDIVKPGSDCSLGFTRPVSNYWVRNIVGDTNCNLFQIGSETADDIKDLYVDNIYVLGANKAGFSISTNDGAHVANVYLNSGKTGPLHHRSVMKRTRAPFFISISNRGRTLGADVKMFTFKENGAERKELLVVNSPIGRVENIHLNGVDISEVYGGSSFRKPRWAPYDGKQTEAAAIIAGFKLPDSENVDGGLNFTMPDGRHTGYIDNISFTDVNLTVKGGHPEADAEAWPPEIGVGRYNVGDLKIQPAYGLWFRHASNVKIDGCTVGAENPDGRWAVYFDDVQGGEVNNLTVKPGTNQREPVKVVRSNNVVIK